MTTISLTSPRSPRELKTLAHAKSLIKSVETQAQTVIKQDETDDDFISGEGDVAVANFPVGKRSDLSGSVSFDPESKEIESINLEKSLPVDVEVDHMMWGSFRGTTSMTMTKSQNQTTYSISNEVKHKITQDYTITVDHKNQTLTYDFQQEKGPWVGRTRGF